MNNAIRLSTVACLAVFALFLSKDALSATVCYQVFDFPSVSRIDAGNKDILKVYFNNRHTEDIKDGIEYTYHQADGWKRGEIVALGSPQGEGVPDSCKSAADQALTKIKLSVAEFVKLRPRYQRYTSGPDFRLDQTISSCHNTAEYKLFGLGFYEGEDTHGYGGIAKFNPVSGKLEIARHRSLAKNSINSIIEFNGHIFAGTTGFYECHGMPPTSGLLLYDWDQEKVSFARREICGGVIHDMAVWNDDLWIATDMGLSKGTRPDDAAKANRPWAYGWQNYIPAKNPDDGLIEVQCKQLYEDLLLDMPQSSEQGIESAIDFLIYGIDKKYAFNSFFADFIEKHKQVIKNQKKNN